jgi:flagellar export protein FliJ
MKSFNFKFSAVLAVKKTKELEALRTLGNARRIYEIEVNKKLKLLEEIKIFQEDDKIDSATRISISNLKLEESYIFGCKQRLIQLDQSLFRANRGVQKALQVYFKAHKENLSMEVLREKCYQEYRSELIKREQKQADDLGVMRSRLKEENV